MLRNDYDCEDAIQETIVKAFSKIDTLKNDKYAKTWLIRILINECHTIERKLSKHVSLEEVNEMAEKSEDLPVYQIGDTFEVQTWGKIQKKRVTV